MPKEYEVYDRSGFKIGTAQERPDWSGMAAGGALGTVIPLLVGIFLLTF